MKERFGFGNCLYFGHLAIDILPAILFYYKKQGRSYPNPCCKANNKYLFGYVYCRLKKTKNTWQNFLKAITLTFLQKQIFTVKCHLGINNLFPKNRLSNNLFCHFQTQSDTNDMALIPRSYNNSISTTLTSPSKGAL